MLLIEASSSTRLGNTVPIPDRGPQQGFCSGQGTTTGVLFRSTQRCLATTCRSSRMWPYPPTGSEDVPAGRGR